MATGGCEPLLPPSRNSNKEKGKKKAYPIKLFSLFNNVSGSSSQPSTPSPNSTARSVPPPLQVPGLTPTPPSIPPSFPQEVATDQWRSPSPHVGSNPTTPTNIASTPPTADGLAHSSVAANFEDVSNNHPIITPVEGG
ncbi:hypothetical protein V8G54_030570 [Vigna mungo]|uniref:Uncharacterized protein n=1 Tax=Vigna mungo TaxID=3915 RepID=A0AAQ3MWZ1_VIGMU